MNDGPEQFHVTECSSYSIEIIINNLQKDIYENFDYWHLLA